MAPKPQPDLTEEGSMIRALMIAALAVAAFGGCSNEPTAPQAVAVSVAAPQEAADKEVLIATQPAGAKVLLQGAEVGATPMKMLIRGDTNIVLEKDGYVRQALMLTPKSDPNVVVTLVPSGEPAAPVAAVAPVAAPAEAAAAPSEQKSSSPSGKASSKKSSGRGDEKTGASEAAGQPAEAATQPAPPTAATAPAEPPKATAPAAPKKTEYQNMRQIKEALRAGTITRAEYASWQSTIRKNRQAEYDATEKDLREGKITESQYKEKIRAIRAKYEG
jgi:hypothetical protein